MMMNHRYRLITGKDQTRLFTFSSHMSMVSWHWLGGSISCRGWTTAFCLLFMLKLITFLAALCGQEWKPASEDDVFDNQNGSTRTLFGSVLRDIYQDDEQAEILQLARQSSCELGFEKVSFILYNSHVYCATDYHGPPETVTVATASL